MPLPAPEPGLVISFSYLWRYQQKEGEDSGRKNRPCVIITAAEKTEQGVLVTVVAVTHKQPENASGAIEIPIAVKQHLGLDENRSWAVVTEANQFIWPGFDIRPILGSSDRYDYGFLPPRLFEKIKSALLDRLMAHRATLVNRD